MAQQEQSPGMGPPKCPRNSEEVHTSALSGELCAEGKYVKTLGDVQKVLTAFSLLLRSSKEGGSTAEAGRPSADLRLMMAEANLCVSEATRIEQGYARAMTNLLKENEELRRNNRLLYGEARTNKARHPNHCDSKLGEGLPKILSACLGLTERLGSIAKLFNAESHDYGNIKNQVNLTKVLAENLLQYITELIERNDPGILPEKMKGTEEEGVCRFDSSQGAKVRAHEHGASGKQAGSDEHKAVAVEEQCVRAGEQQDSRIEVRRGRICEYTECLKIPSFNFPGERRQRFCSKHKLKGMVNERHLKYRKKCECEHAGCSTCAVFNFEGLKRGRFCVQHKLEGMVNLVGLAKKKCESQGCTKRAVFSHKGEPKGRFCGQHKMEGMVDSQRQFCRYVGGCTRAASHNFEGEKGRKFCRLHKLQGMVEKRKKRGVQCEHLGCGAEACFNFGSESLCRFCERHKVEGMINVKNRLCEHPGCSAKPLFKFPGETRRWFCGEHKLKGMVSSRAKKCEFVASGGVQCTKLPSFNFQGETRAKFCSEHKLEGMVESKLKDMVRSKNYKKCEQAECSTTASFAVEGERRGRFCAQHKAEGMVNVVNKKCRQAGCTKVAVFKFEGDEGGSIFCRGHKLDGMVHLCRTLRCARAGCDTNPSFGFDDGQRRRVFCKRHKLEGMVDVTARKVCEHSGCKTTPFFNFEGEKKGRFCWKHKLEKMVDVKSKRCAHAGCSTQPLQKSDFCGRHKLGSVVAGDNNI